MSHGKTGTVYIFQARKGPIYAASILSSKRANTNETAYEYDALQRLVKTTDELNGEIDTAWTKLDEVDSITDARDNATEYDTNAFGEVVEEYSPDHGNIIQIGGTDYTYDGLNRLKQEDGGRTIG